tara:strand:+ start:1516 stop:2523 length:1008 start_codon:yes stop_codon:yes gene_type:complete
MIFYFLTSILLLYFTSKFFLKKGILIEKTQDKLHKKLFYIDKKKTYLGGLFLLITIFFFIFQGNFILIIPFFLIFLIGLLSDLNLINSPKIRLFFQLIVILFLIFLTETLVANTRIDFIDRLLEYDLFKYIFTIFCFLVLINGCNFIDGTNLLLVGYFLIVSICIFSLSQNPLIDFDVNKFSILIVCLLVLFLFNFFSQILMGDSGAYLIGLLFGFFTIMLSNQNLNVSPIYILNLLWYPAFENLFSIIRKISNKTSVSEADNFHLHHFVFKFINKKVKFKKFNNSLSGFVINVFNLIVLALSTIVSYHSGYLALILIFNIIIYLISYNFLKKQV